MRHSRVIFLFALVSTLLLSSPAAARGTASADSGVAPPVYPAPWYLQNPNPCVNDSVILVVMGYEATPCDSFIGAHIVDSRHVVIQKQVYSNRNCFAAPFKFFPVPLNLGLFPAGTSTIHILTEIRNAGSADSSVVAVGEAALDVNVASTCGPGPLPVPLMPFVDSVSFVNRRPYVPGPAQVCPGESIAVEIDGTLPGCYTLQSVELVPSPAVPPFGLPPTVHIQIRHQCLLVCPQLIQLWKRTVVLPALIARDYVLPVEVEFNHCPGLAVTDSASNFERYLANVPFTVLPTCDSVPPPPGDLPRVRLIQVGDVGPCQFATGVACPDESISVHLAGTVPNTCMGLLKAELRYLPSAGILPSPPEILLTFGTRCCECKYPCAMNESPWDATLKLPPLPVSRYLLAVRSSVLACNDSVPREFAVDTASFRVGADCHGPGDVCLNGSFAHPVALQPPAGNMCDATISPQHPATVYFQVRSARALSGLQGRLYLSPRALHISKLEGIGDAAGMHVSWKDSTDGTHFVMFAEHGAPIQASPGSMLPRQVLAVTLETIPGMSLPEMTILIAQGLLGSDSAGGAVPQCPEPPCIVLRVFDGARICSEQPCDFNHDGQADVRDLVLMVHCVNGEGPCPDSAASHFDCDGNGHFDLNDVLCCANSVLLGGCNGCSGGMDSVGGRPEPGVKLQLGPPISTTQGLDLPVRLVGAERVGAAALALKYPTDRFSVSGVDLVGGSADWLRLFQVADGRLRMGVIRTGHVPSNPAPEAVELRVHLAVLAGQQAGGEASVEPGQFSGPDGAGLTVDLGQPTQTLTTQLSLALGVNHPNPFSSSTSFSVTLDQTSQVDVGVYDVAGRRVVTLYQGPLSPGSHDFRWNGRSSDGVALPSGIYFYRAGSRERLISRKMTLLRRD